MATVRIANLSKTYGTGKSAVEALHDVDLSIGDGEFFVVLGPSGAGKTTMLKSVAGLVEVEQGDVEIAGVSMDGVEPYHRNVAMAFESYALYPQKTVFDNLASPLRSGRTGKYTAEQQRQRIDAVTTTLGINHLLKRFPRELSNGQRQRVALGRVLVRPADVYLLDEPLSHLDAKLRAQMRAELKQLGEMSNTTSLYVTHDYQEALALGNRIAVLRAGRVVQVGTPEEIWRRPVDTFVAKALGQPEINLFDVTAADGVLHGAGGDLSVPLPRHLDLPGGRARIGIRPATCSSVPAGRGRCRCAAGCRWPSGWAGSWSSASTSGRRGAPSTSSSSPTPTPVPARVTSSTCTCPWRTCTCSPPPSPPRTPSGWGPPRRRGCPGERHDRDPADGQGAGAGGPAQAVREPGPGGVPRRQGDRPAHRTR